MNEKLLTCREVQSILNVSKSKLYRMIRTGEIPTIRVGSTYRIRMSDLETYLTQTNTISK